MTMDVVKAHAQLLDKLLVHMDAVFSTAVDHPKLSEPDRTVAAEMLLWVRDGRFLCRQIRESPEYDPAPDDPLASSMTVLGQQITDIMRELRKLQLSSPGAPERLRALLDAQSETG